MKHVSVDEFEAFYDGAYPGAKRLAHLVLDGSPAADDVVADAFTRFVPASYGATPDPGWAASGVQSSMGALGSGRIGANGCCPLAPARSALVEIPDPLLDAVNLLPTR